MTIHCTKCGRAVRQPTHGKYLQCASCRDADWLAWERAGKPQQWPQPQTQDDQPTTPHLLRFCAFAGCTALLSRDVAHPCCFVHRQVVPTRISLDELRHQVRYGQLTDWPGARYHADLMVYGDDRLGPLPAA